MLHHRGVESDTLDGWARRPVREVRACFDASTLIVYQAFRAEIALAAVAAGRYVPPFGPGRMTWFKPSFLWMMHRSGWATKPGQEHVLAVRITRAGFEAALGQACLSAYDPSVDADRAQWAARLRTSHVRVQWDPERALDLSPLPWRTLQVGVAGPASRTYVADWITDITDVTPLATTIRTLVQAGDTQAATALLPNEQPYPLPTAVAGAIGATATRSPR